MIYWHNGLWWKVKSTWKRRKGVGMPSFPTFSISKFERNAPKPMYPLMHLFYRVVKTRYSQLKGGQRSWKSHFTIGDSFPTLVDSFMENIQLPIELLKRMVSVSSTTNSCCLQTPESRIHLSLIWDSSWFLIPSPHF